LKTKKKRKNRGETKNIFRTNIMKEINSSSILKIEKMEKLGKKTQKIFLFLKKQKKKAKNKEKEKK
jgi:hypothetical protein